MSETKKPTCATCNDHGDIVGYTGQTAESFGYDFVPCPECSVEAETAQGAPVADIDTLQGEYVVYDALKAERDASTCATCNDHGDIGGYTGQTAESFGDERLPTENNCDRCGLNRWLDDGLSCDRCRIEYLTADRDALAKKVAELEAVRAELRTMSRQALDEKNALIERLEAKLDTATARAEALAAERDAYALAVLKNSGIDTTCGVCMAVAFTGSGPHGEHTCTPPADLTQHQSNESKTRVAELEAEREVLLGRCANEVEFANALRAARERVAELEDVLRLVEHDSNQPDDGAPSHETLSRIFDALNNTPPADLTQHPAYRAGRRAGLEEAASVCDESRRSHNSTVNPWRPEEDEKHNHRADEAEQLAEDIRAHLEAK